MRLFFPIEPHVVRRVQERAEKTRKEILAIHGVQDIGVQFIRQMRGKLRSSAEQYRRCGEDLLE